MRKLLTGIINLLFPPSPTQLLISQTEYSREKFYRIGRFEGNIFLSDYSQPIIRAVITENKFHHNRLAAKFLATLLSDWIKQQEKPCVFVPIPLGRKRLGERGHNQVTTILENCSAQIKVENKLLFRQIETLPQSQLDRKNRLLNMKNVFNFRAEVLASLVGKDIVLVDDVVTTGATLHAARAKLAPHLPPNTNIICLALAH